MPVYGRLDTDNREEERFCILTDWPKAKGLDAKTAELASLGEPIADRFPADARVRMWKHGGDDLGDFVANNMDLLVVSKRVKEAIARVNKGPTEYLPLAIDDKKGKCVATDYFIVNPLGTHDVLDFRRSDVLQMRDGRVVGATRMVLNPKKMKGVPHLFRPNFAKAYVISKKIATEVIALRPEKTNLYYLELYEW